MNYGELRTQFKNLLNRTDCTDEQADHFIGMGLRRVERSLRTPMQEYVWEVEATGVTPLVELPIPNDLLMVRVLELDDNPIPRISVNQRNDFSGYYMEDGYFKFALSKDIEAGQVVRVVYYSEFNFPQFGDADITTFSQTISDVIAYAAMSYACTFYSDMRKTQIEADLSGMITELQNMADLDEMTGTGLQVTPYGGGIA